MTAHKERLPDFSDVKSGSSSQALPEADVSEATYTVEKGDTLWKIAEHFYGDGSKFPALFEANTHVLKDPDEIRPGQVLTIPQL